MKTTLGESTIRIHLAHLLTIEDALEFMLSDGGLTHAQRNGVDRFALHMLRGVITDLRIALNNIESDEKKNSHDVIEELMF